MIPQKALLPNFEEDIFINYAHNDNKARLASFKGWVDTMHEGLGSRLTELIGEEPKIWRDIVLKGYEQFPDTIVFRLSKTAFLVSVFSPSYIKSEWCQKELNEFYARAEQNGGIKINNKSRIFKVVKTPIGDNDPRNDPLKECKEIPPKLRTLLRETLGYNFFEFDENGKLCEFWPELGQEYQKKFLATLEDLACDIKEFIEYQQALSTGPESKKNNIYLAETTPDLCENRNEIKRTLQQHNFRVLPDENLPFDAAAFDEKVRRYLEDSALSIHLIGSDHASTGADPEARRRLNPQYQLAAERTSRQHELAMTRNDNDPQFFRLIWMTTGLTTQDVTYQKFVDYLQNDPAVSDNAEVLCGVKLEDLKTLLQKKLKFRREEGSRQVKLVYLICDRQDMGAIAPLQSFLRQQNYEVLLPFKENGQVVMGHKENLRQCDAVLIFYGSTDTIDWKLKDLRKVAVYRDGKPLLAKGIYVAGPETDQKKSFNTDEALVMKNFEEFAGESIKPFLDQVEGSKSAISTGGVGV